MIHPDPPVTDEELPATRLDAVELGPEAPAEAAAFIRFCHQRRPRAWPDLYDEMWVVAARREFNGWGFEQLEAFGVTFSLFEMPRLARWVGEVLAALPDLPEQAVVVPVSA